MIYTKCKPYNNIMKYSCCLGIFHHFVIFLSCAFESGLYPCVTESPRKIKYNNKKNTQNISRQKRKLLHLWNKFLHTLYFVLCQVYWTLPYALCTLTQWQRMLGVVRLNSLNLEYNKNRQYWLIALVWCLMESFTL